MAGMKTAADERAFHIHYARVILREARARRDQRGGFFFSLLEWAGNARRRAAAINLKPAQMDLFGGRDVG